MPLNLLWYVFDILFIYFKLKSTLHSVGVLLKALPTSYTYPLISRAKKKQVSSRSNAVWAIITNSVSLILPRRSNRRDFTNSSENLSACFTSIYKLKLGVTTYYRSYVCIIHFFDKERQSVLPFIMLRWMFMSALTICDQRHSMSGWFNVEN